jgi:hypothetical protein
MINSDSTAGPGEAPQEAVDGIVRAGAVGALVLAGVATAIVVGLWLAFYLLVFVPRGAVT